MAEEIDFENGRNSKFEGLVTLTLTFDPAVPHTVMHHSSTSTYIPNFIQIEETFCGWTDVRTDGRTGGRTDIFPLYIIRSTLGSQPKNKPKQKNLFSTSQYPGTCWNFFYAGCPYCQNPPMYAGLLLQWSGYRTHPISKQVIWYMIFFLLFGKPSL